LLLSPVASLPASPSCSKVLGIELVAVWGAGGCSRAILPRRCVLTHEAGSGERRNNHDLLGHTTI
jgi:hypothetical protein